MASSYPGAVDALVRPDGTDPLSDGHAALHNATSDAVEAVQTELGVNPAGSEATVAARLTAAEGATTAAQGDATQALADAATADGKAVAAQGDATTGISNAATAQATANAAVPKATYDAHSVLAATTDNTPAAVTVGEQTIVGRKTGGNITALTAAETKTLLAIGQSDVTNLTSDLSAKAPLASPTFTGVPVAPTAAVDTNTTQVATTAFTVAQGYAKIATEGWVSPIRTSGGYTAKTALYTATNDDRVIDCTSGTYTITLPTAVSQAGREFVVTNSGSGVITVDGAGAETVAGAATQSVSGRGHLRIVSDGSNWVVLDGSYADESVGRRLFQWDQNNSRWQMTFGDTGWRDMSASLLNSYTGAIRFRRIGNVVWFVGNVTRATSNSALAIPTGFRCIQNSENYPYFATRSSTTGNLAAFTCDAVLYIYGADSNTYPVNGSYVAGDAWPTTLPGTASGSIPT